MFDNDYYFQQEHESEGGRTPLMKGARAGHKETVEFLIRKGLHITILSFNIIMQIMINNNSYDNYNLFSLEFWLTGVLVLLLFMNFFLIYTIWPPTVPSYLDIEGFS